MNNHSHLRKTAASLISLSLGVVGFVLSVMALLSYKFDMSPFAVRWTDSGQLTENVVLMLDAARYEVMGLLLVSLNSALFFSLRSGSHSHQRAIEAKVDFYSAMADLELDSDASTTIAEGVKPECPDQADVEAQAAQLKIATNEVERLREELRSYKLQLERANTTKAQFLANMSHELRTPMNGIMGMTDLLLASTLSARDLRFVQSISASSRTLLAIINDLLDFSRIESGSLRLEHARFSVRDAVEDVCSSLASNAHAKDIELICYVDDNVPTQMEGDPGRVRQMLNNLIANAIAFTDAGEVVVRLSRCDDASTIEGKSLYKFDVQDTGVGITPEIQVKLFEAFTQADNSTTRSHGGLGMGLAITRELVAKMHGDISFRSRLGEGSRFTFTIQLDDAGTEENTQRRRRSLNGAHVLVVDDNETNRTILYHQLSNWGLVVETVASGELALAALRAAHDRGQSFDVLILDLHMPEMDGLQLAQAIQMEPDFKSIQAIMLTSAILQLDGKELQQLGIYKYVSKPARQSVLHDSLASLMPRLSAQTDQNSPIELQGSDEGYADSVRSAVNASVLLVEDNEVNQDVAIGMLEQLGCSVELACDGIDAVTKGKAKKYDIVLMDCQMPRMDGYEATRIIKTGGSINAPTPILALTANAMEGDREKCLQSGMDDYVTKPIRTKVLSHMLDKWVDKTVEPFDAEVHSATPALLSDELVFDEAIDESFEQTNEVELIELKAIDTIRDLQRPGKPDLLAKVVDIYLAKTPEVIEQLHEGLSTKDYPSISASAHSLKSSSAYLGAEILSAHCKAIEVAVDTGNFDELDELISRIATDYERVQVALADITSSSGKAA